MKKITLILLVFLASCKKQSIETYYQNVQIGNRTWMTLNWDAETYRNGEIIPQITDSLTWVNARYGAWCYYKNDPLNGQRYGKLYNWYAVNDPRGLAPLGWHVPNDQEFADMIADNGLEMGGFNQMFGGYVGYSTHGLSQYGKWWTSNDSDSIMASGYHVSNNYFDQYYYCKLNGFSVRLIKD